MTTKWIPAIGFGSLALVGVIVLFCASCQSSSTKGTAEAKPAAERSGAELWVDNCSRCHNIRPPEEFSDAQWATITTHMRLRADLTGKEQRKITEFLQASN